jgi:hypothetical protein
MPMMPFSTPTIAFKQGATTGIKMSLIIIAIIGHKSLIPGKFNMSVSKNSMAYHFLKQRRVRYAVCYEQHSRRVKNAPP